MPKTPLFGSFRPALKRRFKSAESAPLPSGKLETSKPGPANPLGLSALQIVLASGQGVDVADILAGKKRRASIDDPTPDARVNPAHLEPLSNPPRPLAARMDIDRSERTDGKRMMDLLLKMAGPQIAASMGLDADFPLENVPRQALRQPMAKNLLAQFATLNAIDQEPLDPASKDERRRGLKANYPYLRGFAKPPSERVEIDAARQEALFEALGPENMAAFAELTPDQQTHVYNAAVPGQADGSEAMAYLAAAALGFKLGVVTPETTHLEVMSPAGAEATLHRVYLEDGQFMPVKTARPLVDRAMAGRMRWIDDRGNCLPLSLIHAARSEIAESLGVAPEEVDSQKVRRRVAEPLIDQLVQLQTHMARGNLAAAKKLVNDFPYLEDMQASNMRRKGEPVLRDFSEPDVQLFAQELIGPPLLEKWKPLTDAQKSYVLQKTANVAESMARHPLPGSRAHMGHVRDRLSERLIDQFLMLQKFLSSAPPGAQPPEELNDLLRELSSEGLGIHLENMKTQDAELILDFDDNDIDESTVDDDFRAALGPTQYERCKVLNDAQKTYIYNVAVNQQWHNASGDLMFKLIPMAFPSLKLSVLTDSTTAENLDASSLGRPGAKKDVQLYLHGGHYVPILDEEAARVDTDPPAFTPEELDERFPVASTS